MRFGINIYVLLERKCVREEASVGSNFKHSMRVWHSLYDVIAYACVLSDIFSLLEDRIDCMVYTPLLNAQYFAGTKVPLSVHRGVRKYPRMGVNT